MAAEGWRADQERLSALMLEKERFETEYSQARLGIQRQVGLRQPRTQGPVCQPPAAYRRQNHDGRIFVI